MYRLIPLRNLRRTKGVKFDECEFSDKKDFLSNPDFNFLSFDLRVNRLKSSSFFFKKTKSVVF